MDDVVPRVVGAALSIPRGQDPVRRATVAYAVWPQTEEVIPMNESTWVLLSEVTVGR
jgi:hypothetical protein